MAASEFDKKIDSLLLVINKKKEEISKVEVSKFRTNRVINMEDIDGFGVGSINIATFDSTKLLKLLIRIKGNKKEFESMCKEYNLNLEYKIGGQYSYEDIEADILTQIKKNGIAKEKKDLIDKENTLNSLISPEEITRRKLELIEKELL